MTTHEWPRITVVTPSFNQARFLERTLRSVLEQRYPNLEYLVMDGGSTDGSVELIRAHATALAGWTSEPDRGQAHAINKGFQRSSGEILMSLNSDDTLLPGALERVGRFFRETPEKDVVYGNARIIDEDDRVVRELQDVGFSRSMLLYGGYNIPTQCTFYRRELFFRAGMLREDFSNAFDYRLLLQFCRLGAHVAYLREPLANFRMYPAQKTSSAWARARRETAEAREELFGIRESSLTFRLMRQVQGVRRVALFLLQGQAGYVAAGARRRVRETISAANAPERA